MSAGRVVMMEARPTWARILVAFAAWLVIAVAVTWMTQYVPEAGRFYFSLLGGWASAMLAMLWFIGGQTP